MKPLILLAMLALAGCSSCHLMNACDETGHYAYGSYAPDFSIPLQNLSNQWNTPVQQQSQPTRCRTVYSRNPMTGLSEANTVCQ